MADLVVEFCSTLMESNDKEEINGVFRVKSLFLPPEPLNVQYADVERRLTKRHSLQILVTLRLPGMNLSTTAESLDLTERGLMLETALEVEAGWPVELELILPELVTGGPPTEWHCRGVIAHVTMRDGPNCRRVGISFDCVSVRNIHVA